MLSTSHSRVDTRFAVLSFKKVEFAGASDVEISEETGDVPELGDHQGSHLHEHISNS